MTSFSGVIRSPLPNHCVTSRHTTSRPGTSRPDTSAPSLRVFCSRLKTHLFKRSLISRAESGVALN